MFSFIPKTVLLISLLFTPLSWAEANPCAQRVDIQVNGLVCDFCARALEKVFHKRKEVNRIDVNLSDKQIVVEMNPSAQIENQELKRLITDSGYSVVKIQRGCAS